MSKDFRIPVTMDIPPEVSSRINQRVAEDTTYVTLRARAIEKTYNNAQITNLRKIGEYLLSNWLKGEISVKQIARETGVAEGSVKILIADLNFWREYPLKMIPVKGKPGFIQNSLKDINTTEQYLRQKSRTIASMEQVYENVDTQMSVKKEESEPQRRKEVVEKKQKSKEKEADEQE